jgi:hypothetical protein
MPQAGRQGSRAEGAREHRSEQASRPVSEEQSGQRPIGCHGGRPRNEAGRQGQSSGRRPRAPERAGFKACERGAQRATPRSFVMAGCARNEAGRQGQSSGRRLRGLERAHSNVRERGPQQPTPRSAPLAARVTERTLALTGEGPPDPPNGGKRAGPCPGQIWVRLRHLLRRVSGPLRLDLSLRAPYRSWTFCRS